MNVNLYTNQVLPLERRLCARNSGIGLIGSVITSAIIFFFLGIIFEVPGVNTIEIARRLGVFFILTVILIPIMVFFNLMVAVSSFNVFKTVNRRIAYVNMVFRLLQVLIFIISLVMLYIGLSFFNVVIYLGHLIYALQLLLFGYLVYISRFFLNGKILAVFLIIGGSLGYFIEIFTFFLSDFNLFSTICLLIALVTELLFGIIYARMAIKMIIERSDTKQTIINILRNLGEVTTEQLVEEAGKVSKECKDRIPGTLITLEEENMISKTISKEKKALVWALIT